MLQLTIIDYGVNVCACLADPFQPLIVSCPTQVTSTIETAQTEKLLALQQLVAKSEEKLRLEEASRLKLIQEVQRLREVAVEREKVAAELEHIKQELARQHLGISGQPGLCRGGQSMAVHVCLFLFEWLCVVA